MRLRRLSAGGVSRIHYLKPSEVDSVKASRSILIELPLSKGLTKREAEDLINVVKHDKYWRIDPANREIHSKP